MLIVGGPNTEVDVRKFRHAIHLTVEKHFGENTLPTTTARLKQLIAAKEPGYFYGGWYGIDKEKESRERAFLSDNLDSVLARYTAAARVDQAVLRKQMVTSYGRPNAPPLIGGTPGQSDGSGDLLPRLVLAKHLSGKSDADRPVALAHFLKQESYPEIPNWLATATDNVSVWNQYDRPTGQLDGSVNVPMIRNIAAEVAVVGNSAGVNYRNADITARFTDRLPPPPYPFPIDTVRAARGKVLFEQNCIACHKPGNKEVYPVALIGTDPNRARVQTAEGGELFRAAFLAAIPEDYEATSPNGEKFKPRAFAKDNPPLNDRTHPNNQGYAARPLGGIWASAPYLHNGSVPTLRHLLAPDNPESRRPTVFLRGGIDYDQYNVGFVWSLADAARVRPQAPTAAVFDTRWDGGSNTGHDRDVFYLGQNYRLNFSGEGARQDLDDLIEYLKTY